MSEKMLVTQALDERDLLVKKIQSKIDKVEFVDTIKPNEDQTHNLRMSREKFSQNAEATYQQIMDLIARYEKIDAAIIHSNATTTIETSYGTYTVAGAISLRSRLRGMGANNDFETMLQERIERSIMKQTSEIERLNRNLQATAENMRLSILGKDAKTKDDKPLEVVETYVKENKAELVDPLNVVDKMNELSEKRMKLLAELDTQIKVSNATTFIEI